MHSLALTMAAALGLALGTSPARADVAPAPPVRVDVPPPAAAPYCINIAQIDHTQIIDDQTILFHLRGGVTLRNTLQDRCVGLRMASRGFTYVVRGEEVCGNLQSIRVNDNGAICELGPFATEPPKP
jgi:hypothetical protein